MASFLCNSTSFRPESSQSEPSILDAIHPLKLQSQKIDTEAVKAKYEAERAKRLRPEGVKQFQTTRGHLSHFVDDIFTPKSPRDPIIADTRVLIVGAGFAGVVTAVKLKKDHGIDDFVLLDKAGGLGGTWYWSQFPGAACDVESYIYIPLLEETGYVPKERFSYAPEIREHMDRIAKKWDLQKNAVLHTQATSMIWDESIRRWHVRTNRSDHFTAQFVVLGTGTFHEPKLPGLRGIDTFERPQFHSSRWPYDITGGGPDDWKLTKLADKTVGIIGCGATAVQVIPHLARNAKKLYVFQRTPASVTMRENHKTTNYPHMDIFAISKQPRWQQNLMEESANVLQGTIVNRDCPGLEGLESLTVRELFKQAEQVGVQIKPEEIPELLQMADFVHMEKLRKLIEDTVHNQETAEKLKPWYSFMCKRPLFHNDYLEAFNRPNVELVDTNGQGVSHLTRTGVVTNDREYEVDMLVYSTGYEYETEVNFQGRTGIHLVGREGKSLDGITKEGGSPATLFGIHLRDFPNLLNIGPAQGGVTVNWTHTVYVASEHITNVIAGVIKQDDQFQAIEPTAKAAEEWGKLIEEGSDMRLQYSKSCTPSYYNRHGKPEEISFRSGFFPKGIVEWGSIMKKWRDEGHYEGMYKM